MARRFANPADFELVGMDFDPTPGDLELATHLLNRHGVATLPGSTFGDAETALTLRLATSMLYGLGAAERGATLQAAEPERLAWIVAALERVETAFRALTEAGNR